MMTGIGFSEIALISVLILLFFGSKELPNFIREIAKLLAQLRVYSNRIRSEFDNATRQIQETTTPSIIPADLKGDLRKKYSGLRNDMSQENREKLSSKIVEHLLVLDQYTKAKSVMIYVSVGAEVSTRNLIDLMLEAGKRVVVPFCKTGGNEIGLAEITDPATQLTIGSYGIPEPIEAIRNNFFKSDLQLLICPGVGFDKFGGRLGRGRSYYDNFLRDIKGKIPLVGLAFECQILDVALPFGYEDIPMDQVVTEKGLLIATQ